MGVPTWTELELRRAIKTSATYAEVIKKLGLQAQPGNYRTLRRWIQKLSLDTSHMLKQAHLRGSRRFNVLRPLKEVLVEHSDYNPVHLKKRLILDGLLKNKCYECKMKPVWNGKPLVLRLDHINGVHDDARFENLRLLCPNCDSQTKTFCRGTRVGSSAGRATV